MYIHTWTSVSIASEYNNCSDSDNISDRSKIRKETIPGTPLRAYRSN